MLSTGLILVDISTSRAHGLIPGMLEKTKNFKCVILGKRDVFYLLMLLILGQSSCPSYIEVGLIKLFKFVVFNVNYFGFNKFLLGSSHLI